MVSPDAQEFGKYWLVQRIAAGGMAEVFKARYAVGQDIEKTCVIKRILPHLALNRSFVSMFEDEARICVSLNHHNIVQVFDYGKVGNDHFLAMEYVKGQNLQRILNRLNDRGERMPIPMVLHIASEVAKGLHYAHTRKDDAGESLGIIHRDVSPANVLVSYEGEVKLVDFGIAKAATQSEQTQAGTIKGKASYMAPEYLLGALQLDGRVDVFALGAVVWEMLAGRKLFHGESEMEIIGQVSQAEIPLPSTLGPHVAPALDSVVMGALARDREQRYSNANDFYRALVSVGRQLGAVVTEPDVGEYLQALFEQEMEAEIAADREISKTLAGLSSEPQELSAPTGQPWSPIPEEATNPRLGAEITEPGTPMSAIPQEHTDPGGPAIETSWDQATNPQDRFRPDASTAENRAVGDPDDGPGDSTGQLTRENPPFDPDATDENPVGPVPNRPHDAPTLDPPVPPPPSLDALLPGLDGPPPPDPTGISRRGGPAPPPPPMHVSPEVLREKAKKLAAKAIKSGVLKPRRVRRRNWLRGVLMFLLIGMLVVIAGAVVAAFLGYDVPFVSERLVDVTPVPTATPTAAPTSMASSTPAQTATPAPTRSARPHRTPRATPVATATRVPAGTPTRAPVPTATPAASVAPATTVTATPAPSPSPKATRGPDDMVPAPTVTPEAYEDVLRRENQ